MQTNCEIISHVDNDWSAEMCIEIPYGCNVKYEVQNGKLVCDRVLHTPMQYPFNYGYLTDTLADDGDNLDAVLLTQTLFVPKTHIKVKIIGALITEDEKGQDEKILVMPVESIDPRFKDVNNLSNITSDVKEQIKFFFNYYKTLEKNKWINVKDYVDRDQAYTIYQECLVKYQSQQVSILP